MSPPHSAPNSAAMPGPPCAPMAAAEQTRWLTEEVRPHEAAVRGYIHKQFPSIDADDVVQESYLQLLRAKTLGHISSSKAYFFSIARNTARRVFRRRRIYSDTPVNELPDWRLMEGGADAVDLAEAHQRRALMIEALAQLPDRCREILQLAVLDGLSNSEIAARLNLSESTVRVQVARGVQKCAEFLRERGVRS